MLNFMMGLWDTYSNRIGNNGYALYNSLTHYGTHVDRDSLRGAEYGDRALRQEQEVQAGQSDENVLTQTCFSSTILSSLH